MPSYDTQKLNRLIEERRIAGVVLRDISERRRTEKEWFDKYRIQIMNYANRRAIDCGQVDRLLNMPTDEARAMKAKDVEEFAYLKNDGTRGDAYTGIGWNVFRSYIEHRDLYRSLNEQVEIKGKEFRSRFAIVPHLCDAVVAWGFKRPDTFY